MIGDPLRRCLQRFLPVFVYLAFPVVMYARPLAQNRFRGPGINDLQSQLGLFWLSAQESLRAGEWPVGWTDALFAGMPFASNAQLASFYPLKFLMLLTPDAIFPAAFTAFIGLHFTIGSGGAHVLARSMGAGRGFAMAAGLGYVASGWFVGHDTHIPIILPAAWLPWVLYGLLRATRTGDWLLGTLIAAGALAMQAVCAGFQLILYAALASPFLVLLPRLVRPSDSSWSGILRAFVGAGVVAGALGVGIAACQVVPTFTMSEWSYRSTVGGAEFTAFGARSLADLALVLSPGALGGVWENPAPQNEFFCTLGGALLVAAAVACLSANRLRAVALVVGSVFFLLLSMGPGSPVDSLVRAIVPFWDAFRYAARVWLLGHLALLLLVAVELPAALERASWKSVAAVGLGSAGLGAAALLVSGAHLPAVLGFVAAAAIGLTACLVAQRSQRPQSVGGVLAMVILLEGLVAFPPVQADVRVDSGMFQEGQEIARYLTEHRDEGRALTLPNTRWGWGPMFNSGVVYGWSNLNGYEPQMPRRLAEYFKELPSGGPDPGIHVLRVADPVHPRILRAGVRFVVLPRFIDHSAVPGLATATPVAVDERHYVLKLPQPSAPEAWAVTDWAETRAGAVPPLGSLPDTTFVEGLASSDVCEGTASVRNLIVRPGEVSLDIDTPCDAVVVVAQGYHAGWHALVDGAETAVHPADHAFVGVPVVAGTHRVQLEWVDASTRLGVLVSVGCTPVIGVLFAVLLHRRRKLRGAKTA